MVSVIIEVKFEVLMHNLSSNYSSAKRILYIFLSLLEER